MSRVHLLQYQDRCAIFKPVFRFWKEIKGLAKYVVNELALVWLDLRRLALLDCCLNKKNYMQVPSSTATPFSSDWISPRSPTRLEFTLSSRTRFVKENNEGQCLRDEQILRVATDVSKVNKYLQGFAIDAPVSGDMNENGNSRLFKQAWKQLNDPNLVCTMCAGAAVRILHKSEVDIAVIDEVSQIPEPCVLILFVKGTRRAILVVKEPGKALEFDISPLERLYTGDDRPGVSKTMLDNDIRGLALALGGATYQQSSSGILTVSNHSSEAW
ncbi:hypothetical protein IW262DRAFT_1302665 [Armillaria fumosa]|nr:hypothetical protein IW262DRAFT_1302665 [Armillaria fumosa]